MRATRWRGGAGTGAVTPDPFVVLNRLRARSVFRMPMSASTPSSVGNLCHLKRLSKNSTTLPNVDCFRIVPPRSCR